MPRRVSRVPRNSAYRLAIEGEISAPNAGGAREILRRTARKIDRCRQWGRDEHRVPRQRALSSAIRGYAACRPPIPPVWRRRHMRPGIHIELSGIQMTYLPAVQLLGSYGPEEDAMIRTLTLALALAAGSAAAMSSGTAAWWRTRTNSRSLPACRPTARGSRSRAERCWRATVSNNGVRRAAPDPILAGSPRRQGMAVAGRNSRP